MSRGAEGLHKPRKKYFQNEVKWPLSFFGHCRKPLGMCRHIHILGSNGIDTFIAASNRKQKIIAEWGERLFVLPHMKQVQFVYMRFDSGKSVWPNKPGLSSWLW